MKSFEYAKNKKKSFKMPEIPYGEDYLIPLWALPIAPFVITYDKVYTKIRESLKWDEKKAKKVLDYGLPYVLEYSEDKNAYYCYKRTITDTRFYKKAPLGLRLYANKFTYPISDYLKDSYEKEGFLKEIERDWYDGSIIFWFKPIDN